MKGRYHRGPWTTWLSFLSGTGFLSSLYSSLGRPLRSLCEDIFPPIKSEVWVLHYFWGTVSFCWHLILPWMVEVGKLCKPLFLKDSYLYPWPHQASLIRMQHGNPTFMAGLQQCTVGNSQRIPFILTFLYHLTVDHSSSSKLTSCSPPSEIH